MNAYERLLKYVVIRTPSNEESETTPGCVGKSFKKGH